MQFFLQKQKPIAVLVLVAFTLGLSAPVLFAPKKADAFLGIGDFTFNVTVGDVIRVLEDIGKGILVGFLLAAVNVFIQRYVNRIDDKLKVRDYLSYAQRLADDVYFNRWLIQSALSPTDKYLVEQVAKEQGLKGNTGNSRALFEIFGIKARDSLGFDPRFLTTANCVEEPKAPPANASEKEKQEYKQKLDFYNRNRKQGIPKCEGKEGEITSDYYAKLALTGSPEASPYFHFYNTQGLALDARSQAQNAATIELTAGPYKAVRDITAARDVIGNLQSGVGSKVQYQSCKSVTDPKQIEKLKNDVKIDPATGKAINQPIVIGGGKIAVTCQDKEFPILTPAGYVAWGIQSAIDSAFKIKSQPPAFGIAAAITSSLMSSLLNRLFTGGGKSPSGSKNIGFLNEQDGFSPIGPPDPAHEFDAAPQRPGNPINCTSAPGTPGQNRSQCDTGGLDAPRDPNPDEIPPLPPSPSENDIDGDGIPDDEERGEDRNGNGIPDDQENNSEDDTGGDDTTLVQPRSLTLTPGSIRPGEKYAVLVGNGRNMTIDIQWRFERGVIQETPGWVSLDEQGKAIVATAEDAPEGLYTIVGIRNTIHANLPYIPVNVSIVVSNSSSQEQVEQERFTRD